MYKEKRTGPKTDPCITLDVTLKLVKRQTFDSYSIKSSFQVQQKKSRATTRISTNYNIVCERTETQLKGLERMTVE